VTTAIVDPTRDGSRLYRFLRSIPTWVLWALVVVWLTPTLGLLVNSLRTRGQQQRSGWWNVLLGDTEGFTLDNYRQVLADAAGNVPTIRSGLAASLAISLPATIIPIGIAAFAAYAFAWIDFRGRQGLFIATVSLLAIPLQVALVPLLRLFNFGAHLTIPWLDKTITVFPDLGIDGTTNAVWLSHTAFGMPFAIFLLHNYISSLPRDLFEAARIDGADHFRIFWRLVLPLSVPVLAAFAIFQFLWTWNDYLVSNVLLRLVGSPDITQWPTTLVIAGQASASFGSSEHLLTAGAFIQSAIPLVVFFLLQRFFVRGLLAGSVKG
jgi:alpha-glucoside transport system permease protein